MDGEVFVNTQMLADYPDMASPIYAQGKLYGFAAVYDLPAENFTVFYQNLMRILTSLIERNLSKALRYEEARRKEMYIDGTELLKKEAFAQQWKILTQMDLQLPSGTYYMRVTASSMSGKTAEAMDKINVNDVYYPGVIRFEVN